MKVIIAIFTIASILASNDGWAKAEKHKYEYLIEATDHIFEIQRRSDKAKTNELLNAMKLACDALDRLLDEKKLEKDLNRLSGKWSKNQKNQIILKHNLVSFFNLFAEDEMELLKSADVSETSISNIIAAAAHSNQYVKNYPETDSILHFIGVLRREICNAEETISQSEDRWSHFKRWAIALGGVTLIAVDATASAPASTIAATSVAIGLEVVKHAILQ